MPRLRQKFKILDLKFFPKSRLLKIKAKAEGRLSQIFKYFEQFSLGELRTKQIPNLFFVCGGNGTEKGQIRNDLILRLQSEGHVVVKPEDFLQFNNGQLFKKDLLELERYYAALVSLIPISCESYGSAAELGAFVNDEYIREKLFVIIQQNYYDDANSFISNGLIKNFEFHISGYGRKRRVFTTTANPIEELDEIYDEITKSNFISSKCDFNNPYFQIQLLMTILNALIISDNYELQTEFENILVKLGGSFSKDSFDEMISVGKHLKKLFVVSSGVNRYYLAADNYTYLERESKSHEKLEKLKFDFRSVRNFYFERIYNDTNTKENKKKRILEKYRNEHPLSWQKVEIPKSETEGHVIKKAPLMYKVFYIPKRSGGLREISQPTAIVKELQRRAIEEVSSKIQIHENAVAYIKGKNGILSNAEIHKSNKYFYKFDFKNFFPSIKANHIMNLLEKNNFSIDDISRLTLLFTKLNKNAKGKNIRQIMKTLSLSARLPDQSYSNLYEILSQNADVFELSIGAPSSPFISNSIMFNFDKDITVSSSLLSLSYSRFADDLTFSSNQRLDIGIIRTEILRALNNAEYDYLALNDKKQRFITFKERVTITGVNITPSHSISIGRDQKKLISSMVHKFSIRKLSRDTTLKLKGWLAYVNSVEPQFLHGLRNRYGADVIMQIFNFY